MMREIPGWSRQNNDYIYNHYINNHYVLLRQVS